MLSIEYALHSLDTLQAFFCLDDSCIYRFQYPGFALLDKPERLEPVTLSN